MKTPTPEERAQMIADAMERTGASEAEATEKLDAYIKNRLALEDKWNGSQAEKETFASMILWLFGNTISDPMFMLSTMMSGRIPRDSEEVTQDMADRTAAWDKAGTFISLLTEASAKGEEVSPEMEKKIEAISKEFQEEVLSHEIIESLFLLPQSSLDPEEGSSTQVNAHS